MSDRTLQRRRLRNRRRALSIREREHCSRLLCQQVARHPLFRRSQRIASYIPADGEISPLPIVELAWSMGKQVYLPVLIPFVRNGLWFSRYSPASRLVVNQFGIPEPEAVHRQRVKAQALDLVLAPLVGFDRCGNRLGMGGGFYDRTFSFLLYRNHWCKPRILGLAYDFQRLPQLPAQPWDVPLTAVATNTGCFDFR